MSKILGISCYYHDSAITLIDNGDIVFAAQEERFSRIKNDNSFPSKSLRYLTEELNVKLSDIDYIVFYEKPFLKFLRLIETYIAFAPIGFSQFLKSMPIWLKEKLFQKLKIIEELNKIEKNENYKNKLRFSEHHLSHAGSAFFVSPFDNAIVITLDGVGEWTTSSIFIGKNNKLEKINEIRYPHSLGLIYSAFTYYCGFEVNEGEYKLMGLAPYGKPIYKKKILENLIKVNEDGSFQLNMKFFNYCTGLTMINSNFIKLFKRPPRKKNSNGIDVFYMDIAASIQEVIEEVIIKICRYAQNKFKINNLCIAGGVALNCVANGKILKEKIFENIWIQPAAGDAGGALGAALCYWYMELKNNRTEKNMIDKMKGSYLGPKYSNNNIKKLLDEKSYKFKFLEDEQLYETVSQLISRGNVIGWFQGRMEFGPRALGNRSILGDPRNEKMQSIINQKVKFREGFRPFAPAVLSEQCSEWFDLDTDSPYMLLVTQIKNSKKVLNNNIKNGDLLGLEKLKIIRSKVPSVTHVDFSSRIQTVNGDFNKKFRNLIEVFFKQTECPMLINTSFNLKSEPIVCSPEDAVKCFEKTNLDYLIMENYILDKKNFI